MNSSPIYCWLLLSLIAVLVSLVVCQGNGTTASVNTTVASTAIPTAAGNFTSASNVNVTVPTLIANVSATTAVPSTAASSTTVVSQSSTTVKAGASQRYVLPTVAVVLLPVFVVGKTLTLN